MAKKPTYKELEQRITVLEEESAKAKLTGEATKRERQRLYEVLETLPAYVVLLTPDYHVPFANRFFRERFGESHGKRCFEYLFSRTEACETCETYTVMKTHAPHHWEWTGPDGRNYDISDFPFTDTDGSSLILEMGVDITERKQAEKVLREAHNSLEVRVRERTAELARKNAQLLAEIEDRRKAEEALRQSHKRAAWLARFPEENPHPVVRVSLDGSVLYINPAAVETVGWTCAVGQPMDYRLRRLVSRATAEGKEAQQDVEIERRLYSVWVTPFPAEGYANVYGRDITDRKQAEETLRRERDFTSAVLDNTGGLVVVLDREGRISRFNRACEAITGYASEEVLGRVFWEFLVLPDELPGVKEQWDALTAGDFPNQHENHWVAKDGSRHLITWSNTAILTVQGDVEYIIGTGLDITERKNREERITRLTKLYAVLSRVNEMIVRTRDEGLLYEGVCRIVAEEGEFPLVWVGQVVKRQVAPVAWHGQAADYLEEIKVEVDGELGNGPTGTCVREDRPVVNDDFDVNPSTAPWREPALRHGFRASAAFPVHRQGQVVGVLTLYATVPGIFDTEQVELLEALCADISYALDAMHKERLRAEAENAVRQRTLELQQLTETLDRRVKERTNELEKANEALRHLSSKLLSAQEEERKKIAGDLHDTMGSCLAGIKFKVENVLEEVRKGTYDATDSLSAIIPAIQEGVEECRRMQMDLRPAMLDDLGLLPTLSWFCRRFQTIYSGIRIEQEIAIQEDDIPQMLKIVLFRVTQEAMNNIAKHSKADLVHFSLRKLDNRLELGLQDNGRGFNLEEIHSRSAIVKGLGLTSMKERAQLSGGSFDLESVIGKGTTIRISWPT